MDGGIPRYRQPSWHDVEAAPQPGERCVACRGRYFWCEVGRPRGWRCACCIPAPVGLVTREVET